MKKVVVLIAMAAVLSLSGCGWADRVVAHVAGTSQVCVDGVAYLQFASGATVKYNRDGKIATCN